MELEQVDVVRPHPAEAQLDVGLDGFLILSAALGGDHDVVADVVEGLTDLLLAVGIHVGGIEIVDAALIGPAQQLPGGFVTDALHRQRAEGGLGNVELRPTQADFWDIHGSSPFRGLSCGACPFPPF